MPRAMSDAPSLAPGEADTSLGAVADSVAGRRRIIVTLAEEFGVRRPAAGGRGAGAGALRPRPQRRAARPPARRRRQWRDGGGGRPAGIHRPPRRRGLLRAGDLPRSPLEGALHSRRPQRDCGPGLAGERFATLLAALDHTYDHVIVDCADEAIAGFAPGGRCGAGGERVWQRRPPDGAGRRAASPRYRAHISSISRSIRHGVRPLRRRRQRRRDGEGQASVAVASEPDV